MGTSTSSSGPGSGVPLVPPWAPPAPPLVPNGPEPRPELGDPNSPTETEADTDAPRLPSSPVAVPARFGPARTALGGFGRTGSREDLRRGVGSYVSKGYSGSRTAATRFSGTAATASTLGNVLFSLANDQVVNGLDKSLLAAMDGDELLDNLVEAIRKVDGTQDAEAERSSTREALSETLELFPDEDPLNLSEEARAYAVERFVALDVFNRFVLDVGLAIQASAPNAIQALSRLEEAKDYIAQTVGSAFRSMESKGVTVTSSTISSLVRTVLQDAFEVFEEYVP